MRLYMMGFLALLVWNFVSKLGFITDSWMFVGIIFMFVGSFYASCEKVSLESSFRSSIYLMI